MGSKIYTKDRQDYKTELTKMKKKAMTSKCKLCQKERELQKSHIIPEFMFKPLYDDKHRIISMSTKEEVKDRYIQKGIREYLLCKECEERFSKLETYAADLIFQKVIFTEKNENSIIVKNVDYNIFKLFQLSILWRASISQLKEFKEVYLGPHEEKIRNLLLNNNPDDPHQYCCMIFYSSTIPLSIDLLLMPDMVRIEKHRCYRFILNGLFWIYFVSSHTDSLPEQLYLSRDGTLPILDGKDFFACYYYRRALEMLKNNGNKKLIRISNKKQPY